MTESSMKDAWLTIERLSVILGILALAFAAGANWHRIDALDLVVVDTRKMVADDVVKEDLYFVRKDVLQEQLSAIRDRLEELKRLIEAKSKTK